MPVAANANALVAVADALAYLKAGASDTDTVQDIINRASDYCEAWCNRALKAKAFTDLRLPSQRMPRLRPVVTPIDIAQTISIDVDAVAQTIWRTEADGDPKAKDVIVGGEPPGLPTHFSRASGWFGSSWGGSWAGSWGNPYPIRISYTGGFNPIPGQLVDAAFAVIENIWRHQTKKLSDVTQTTNPVSGQAIYQGGFSLIPMKAKQTLDLYRVNPV